MRLLKSGILAVVLMLIAFSLWAPLSQGAQPPPYTRLISRVTEAEETGNATSRNPSISNDGLYVAFDSEATDLVLSDTNGVSDVFVYYRTLNMMTRVSMGIGGAEANGPSSNPVISPDGRYILFESEATNLVSGDTNGFKDIFLYDRTGGVTIRVSVGPGGAQAVGGDSISPSVSFNAEEIVYASRATNLISNDGNPYQDIFLYNRASASTVRISMPSAPATTIPNGDSEAPYISPNGDYVVYTSVANNLVPNDQNDFCGQFSCGDIFLRDLAASTTTLITLASNGEQANNASSAPAVSDNGRYIVFQSDADNLDLVFTDFNFVPDIFVRDKTAGTTIRVSKAANGSEGVFASFSPHINRDGNWVTFSTASNLVTGDTNNTEDVYRVARTGGSHLVVSLPEEGGEANGASTGAVMSGGGERIAFVSDATNLVGVDENDSNDVFVRLYIEEDAPATNTPTATMTLTPSSTATPSNTPTVTNTPTPSVTGTICVGCPPTFTPTAGTVVPTFTRTGTPRPGYVPGLYLPVIQK